MDETDLIERLRVLGTQPIDADVAAAHLSLIESTPVRSGPGPRHLVAAAVAFAILAAGVVTAISRSADQPAPAAETQETVVDPTPQPFDPSGGGGVTGP